MQTSNIKVNSKIAIFIAYILVLLNIISILTFNIFDNNYNVSFSILATVTIISCLFVIFYERKTGFINPISFFIISMFFFILVRPVFYSWNISTELDKVITAGFKPDKDYVFFSFFIINISLVLTLLFYFICKPLSYSIAKYVPSVYFYNKHLCGFFLILGIFFTGIFLIKSYYKFILLGEVSVFEAEKYGLHDGLYWFVLAKYSYIVSLLLSKNKNFILYSFLIFIASIGYILVGLRGYTIAYFFLLLFFFDFKYTLKIKHLLCIVILITTASSFILNYRIGIEVNKGFLEMIFNPMLQQGASFETVYGALKYKESLTACISYFDYFFSNKDIGSCIDNVRGVYFSEGGSFATSFYSEMIFFGVIFGGGILFLFSFVLSFVQVCYDQTINSSGSSSYSFKLILFLSIPNLIYFARSSIFDFIIKVIMVVCFIYLLLFFKKCLTIWNNSI
ncbi:hypothetical protein [Xenorhabdus santafensis]|uniref:hypothetical protein n=1 Tax=Xenorhabdus santafensis TaxID=2582833 RepID=UPI0029E82603|nr:hypothetical protein [Xenorhabdus sp. 12]